MRGGLNGFSLFTVRARRKKSFLKSARFAPVYVFILQRVMDVLCGKMFLLNVIQVNLKNSKEGGTRVSRFA
jgi:hypothetical protein